MSPVDLRRIVNIHAHHHRGHDFSEHVAQWKAEGALRTCVACMDPEWAESESVGYFTNDDLLPHLAKHSDHVLGMAWMRMRPPIDGADAVRLRRGEGFAGLKCIDPCAPYDDERFFPIYETAEALGMPILFHTGYLGGYPGTAIYARSHSRFMEPWHLEHVSRRFPALRIIGAHLGHPHYVEALHLVTKCPNAYYDFSGAGGVKSWVSELKWVMAPFPGADWDDPEENLALQWFRKMCFGTDNPPVRLWRRNAEHIMDYLHVPDATRERFYWQNAAEIFRLDL